MNTVDLHMHTYFSDGQASPQEVLEHAASIGLKTIAITDHENTYGNREAQTLAPQFGIEVIPAMEIVCHWEGYTGHGGGPDIDLLAYFIDLESPVTQQVEARLFEGMKQRATAVCKLLQERGVKVTLEDALDVHPYYPGYLAMYTTLVRKAGLSRERAATEIDAVYHRSSIPIISIEEGIQLIHDMGGVAVLAHPSIVDRVMDAEPLSERGIMDLKKMGLDGLEVYHYRLRERQRQHFKMLAKMANLLVTGGSDDHGGPGSFKRMGSEPITEAMLEALRERRTQLTASR